MLAINNTPLRMVIHVVLALCAIFITLSIFAPLAGASQEADRQAALNSLEKQLPLTDQGWPHLIKHDKASLLLYQPQLDSWEDARIKLRQAIALLNEGSTEPLYGVLRIEAQTQVDNDSRQVFLENVSNFTVSFPSETSAEGPFIKEFKEDIIKSAGVIALDRLEAALAVGDAERKGQSVVLNNTPPRIIFADQPAILITLDGAPAWRPVEGTRLERAINTRALLLKDGTDVYLHFLDGYLTASSLDGPWRVALKAPDGASVAEEAAQKAGTVDLLTVKPEKEGDKAPTLGTLPGGKPPSVYVSSQPTELLVTDGAPDYKPIEGTDLLYVANTSANIFKYLKDQQAYVLLSGRWFKAKNLNGPWSYVRPESLPKTFAAIPDASVKENVKASVPGTEQAKEATVAAQIPQTAKIKIAEAKFTPALDEQSGNQRGAQSGTAKLASIPGTQLQYVLNSADPIIRVNSSSWYALHNAVWFTAANIGGPWKVAVSVPAAIYAIPPSSPIHYVVYVKIYDSTPEYVFIGYTPGYYGEILTPSGVVVYGTGYSYAGWSGSYWYGPPVTYGLAFALCWTPWGGWAFDCGFGWHTDNNFYFGWCYPPAPWWGPYYYRGSGPNVYGGYTAWGPNGWTVTTGNVYGRWGNAATVRRGISGYDAVSGNQFAQVYGRAYNSQTGALAVGRRGAVENVYTGSSATGGHIAGIDPSRGIAGAAGRTTIDNARTGRETTFGHSNVYVDGKDMNSAWVRGEDGSISRINNNVFSTKDGQLYRYDPSNSDHWQPVNKPQPGQEQRQQIQQDRQQGQQGQQGQPARQLPRDGRAPDDRSREIIRDRQATTATPARGMDQQGHIQRDRFDDARARDQLNREQLGRDIGERRSNTYRSHGVSLGGFERPGSIGARRFR